MNATTPMTPVPCRVLSVRRETPSVRTLRVAPTDSEGTASFEPGRFNMLYVFGVGEVPISLSGTGRDGSLYHTVRDVGAVTRAICRLKRGDVVGVRGPFGVGWPLDVARGRDVMLVAGGLGIAPLRSALRAIVAERSAYGRVALLYATRRAESVMFLEEMERAAARHRVDLHITVDRANAGWEYDVGPVTPLLRTADVDPSDAIAMTCGPEPMMRFVATELHSRGMAEEQMYLSLERNMKCAIDQCGHCQLGPLFVCGDGPVFRYDRVADLLAEREA